GIEKSKAMDILLDSPVSTPILKAFRPRIENENYEANFPLKHLQKDLQLFTDTAYENNKAAPLTNSAKEVYALAKQHKMGDLDFSAVFKFLNDN
ncbi:MAG: NAD-binding protein, partial [Gillisia sp.]